jgi:hypothetical protein
MDSLTFHTALQVAEAGFPSHLLGGGPVRKQNRKAKEKKMKREMEGEKTWDKTDPRSTAGTSIGDP